VVTLLANCQGKCVHPTALAVITIACVVLAVGGYLWWWRRARR
jgi:hypothetical protein